jgi:hypothetical protein
MPRPALALEPACARARTTAASAPDPDTPCVGFSPQTKKTNNINVTTTVGGIFPQYMYLTGCIAMYCNALVECTSIVMYPRRIRMRMRIRGGDVLGFRIHVET